MKKFGVMLFGAFCTFSLLAGVALAQSSGNFSAQADTGVCTLNDETGVLSPTCTPTANGTQCVSLAAPFKISNGSGNTLLVTPSMVTGLFTDTKINTTVDSSSADVGVQVCVSVTNPDGSPADGAEVLGGNQYGCVTYDQRFQEITSGLFSQISSCAVTTTTTPCTTDAGCTSLNTTTEEYTCGAGGYCQGIPTACNFDMILSTLSAHSYNFIVEVPGGNYNVNAAWSLIGVNTTGKSNVAACAGPGTLTVTQTKVYNNSGSVSTN